MSLIRKENIVIVVDTYMKDGQEKNVYKTVGEIVHMNGSDGPYSFGRLWGPTGSTKFNIFPQDQQRSQQPVQQQAQSAPPVDDFDDDIPF